MLLLTDNEKKMEVTRCTLKEHNPSLTMYGCSAHWLNLLGQDVTPSKVVTQVVEINKYFRNHHVPGALLGEIEGSIKPHIPGVIRWNSQLQCIETFLRNCPYMILIAAKDEDLIEDRIKNLIQNVGLFNEVKSLRQQLSPIADALNKLQGDSATIADACEKWLNLLEVPDLEPCQNKVLQRFKQAVNPAHYLANLLHPVYRGKKLKPNLVSNAQEVMAQEDPETLPNLLNFMCDCLEMPKSMLTDACVSKTRPTVWWQCVKKTGTVNLRLGEIACQLGSMPASSASTEMVFSNFGIIRNKLRNRLGLQKAAKLVMCYRELSGSEEIDL